jgi:hypothetical protein
MVRSLSKAYVDALEDALLEYCEKFGPTEQALIALRMAPTTSEPEPQYDVPPRPNRLFLLAFLYRERRH